MPDSPNKEAALALANRGIRVFPCNVDKKPMVAAWEDAATNSPFAVSLKWDAAPTALPALPVGAHGLVVIDADRKSNGPDGVAAFHALCASERIDLSAAFVVETPSTGQHFYFASPTPYGNSRGTLPDGIDVRGLRGFVIAPGATLPDGRSYRIVSGSWDAVPPLPDALARFLREKSATMPLSFDMRSDAPLVGDRERGCASAALAEEVAKLRAMPHGSGRNRALNEAAHSLGTMAGWIDLNEVASALYEASVENGYVAKDGASAAQHTIASGIEAGRKKPRKMLTEWTAEELAEDEPGIRAMIEAAKRKQAKPAVQATGRRSVTVLQGASIVEKPITWLWDGYLPSGKLTLLAGAGGTGKSTIAFSLAATITNGGSWPDGSRLSAAGNVLIWSSEDDPADTIKPRLMAVGANDHRYGIISGTTNEQGLPDSFDASRDMDGLRDAVNGIGGVSLLIIDPIISAVTGDMHKANDVRRSLQAIVDFAAKCDCAVLGITHFAKGTAGRNSAERVIGSQAFAALARMVLVAAKEEESDRRVFTRAKSNNSVDTGGYSYSIEALTLNRGIVATRVVWGEALEGSSRSILSEVEGESTSEGSTKRDRAKRFLLDTLRSGPVSTKELMEHAREALGISKDTLRLAQGELGIVPRKLALREGWVWELPTLPNGQNAG